MTKPSVLLRISSLLSMVLLTIHITDDIVRGFDRFSYVSYIAIVVNAVVLGCALLWPERKAGLISMLLIGIFAAGMPAIHMKGASWPSIPKTDGGFLFIWILWLLGINGMLAVLLVVRELVARRRSTQAA